MKDVLVIALKTLVLLCCFSVLAPIYDLWRWRTPKHREDLVEPGEDIEAWRELEARRGITPIRNGTGPRR